MSLSLIKLCVGTDSLKDLADWQKSRKELMHITRHTPKRKDELLAGGSIYWVIKGWLLARQRLKELKPVTRNGVKSCGLIYDRKLIRVEPKPVRAFQGWRYLENPPSDLTGEGLEELPEKMFRELAELGLV